MGVLIRRTESGYCRETKQYPSAPITSRSSNTSKKESPVYTGTLVVGIATMHKSNPIPVTAGMNTNPKLHTGGK